MVRLLFSVNGQKVTGQTVTELLGQKVTIYIFYPGGQKVTICIHLDSCTYAGRTESHNMYTLIHACMHNFAICIVLKTDRNIVYGSFCCFELQSFRTITISYHSENHFRTITISYHCHFVP